MSTAHRQRLCSVKTGGGEPSEDPEPCNDPWLKAMEHHIFNAPRFAGLGDLEAGVEVRDSIGAPLSYKQLTRLSRGCSVKRRRENANNDEGKYAATAHAMERIEKAFRGLTALSVAQSSKKTFEV